MFITFEGPDGSGKSTIMKLVFDKLKELNFDVVQTREPGGTRISETLREIILDKDNKELTARTEGLLYAAARAQHVEEFIVPNLNNGKVVLSDRYVLSSLAYQGAGRELGIENIKKINDFATNNLEPDLILFFKVDPLTTLKRKNQLESADRLELEAESFHSKVYNGYLDIMNKYKGSNNFIEVDATKSIEEVFEFTLGTILENIRR